MATCQTIDCFTMSYSRSAISLFINYAVLITYYDTDKKLQY